MLEHLKNTMWLVISTKINKSVDETKNIITRIEKRFLEDSHFDILNLDKTLQDAFEYYLKSKKDLCL